MLFIDRRRTLTVQIGRRRTNISEQVTERHDTTRPTAFVPYNRTETTKKNRNPKNPLKQKISLSIRLNDGILETLSSDV